jgi:predicted DNA-binding transcriptional regulator YafY
VEPHHMVNYLGNWHLIAFCHLRDGWHDFMLSRMSQTQVGVGTFPFRRGEEWRPYLSDSFGIFQNREVFEVVLRFTPERARWVKGELWQQGQMEEIETDGSLVLTIPVSHEAEIMMEILKHGSQVEVVEPQWLREKVIEEMERAVVSYRSRE